ncbi:MAG TPA: hypothetical protein VM901_09250 [Bdellovibrionota bacterium]|nr:hypothetical protein [Bdellovibrionota bacterium]
MNRKARLYPIWLLTALLAAGPVLAAGKVKKKKLDVRLPTSITKRPTGVLSYASDVYYAESTVNVLQAMYLAKPTDDSIIWAEEVGSYVMSEKVINFMEEKYTAAESHVINGQIRNFVYLYGFDATSQDLRGSAMYGIDPRQELELRKNMTSSFRGYMLGKGLMEYAKTTRILRPWADTAEHIEKASQLNVEIQATESKTPGDPVSPPWKIKTGPDLGSRTLFAKAEKGPWSFEIRDSIGFSELTATGSRTYYRSKYSVKYFNESGVVTPSYQYEIAKMWWAKWSADVPVTGTSKSDRMFQTVGLRHLF